MSDDLIKRLRRCFNGLEGLQTDQGDYGVLAEAAAALAEAHATIARLEAALNRINDKAVMNAGEFARYVREECAALSPRGGDG